MPRRRSARDARAVAAPPFRRPVPVPSLVRSRAAPFDLSPDAAEAAVIAAFLGLEALPALRFKGEIAAIADESWRIAGRLTATVVQTCVVSLDPVERRIDQAIARDYVPEATLDPTSEIDLDPEAEDEPDGFRDVIDPGLLALESLALELDPYPKAPGVEPVAQEFAPPGAGPIADDALNPFAKLAALKEKLGREQS